MQEREVRVGVKRKSGAVGPRNTAKRKKVEKLKHKKELLKQFDG